MAAHGLLNKGDHDDISSVLDQPVKVEVTEADTPDFHSESEAEWMSLKNCEDIKVKKEVDVDEDYLFTTDSHTFPDYGNEPRVKERVVKKDQTRKGDDSSSENDGEGNSEDTDSNYAVNTATSSSFNYEPEYIEVKPEGWNFEEEESVVKTEVLDVDLGHFSETEFTEEDLEPFPSFPYSSSLAQENSDCNDVTHPSKPKPRRRYGRNKCGYCPFVNDYDPSFHTHLKVHARGVIAIVCPDCGVHVLPDTLEKHREHHAKIRARQLQQQQQQRNITGKIAVTSSKITRRKIKPRRIPILPNDSGYGVSKIRMGGAEKLLFSCFLCPYTVKSSKREIQSHVKLHKRGSRAVTCPECGFHVLPERMKAHEKARHPQLSKTNRKILKKELKKQKKKGMKRSRYWNPNFKTIDTKNGRQYKCRHCRYRTIRRGNMDIHVELHEEGSRATPCETCGWFVLPEYMELHFNANHVAKPKEPKRRQKDRLIVPVFKCSQCPHESRDRPAYESHFTLHAEGSDAKPCQMCGVFLSRKTMEQKLHYPALCSRWRRRQQIQEAKEKARQNEEVKDLQGEPNNGLKLNETVSSVTQS